MEENRKMRNLQSDLQPNKCSDSLQQFPVCSQPNFPTYTSVDQFSSDASSLWWELMFTEEQTASCQEGRQAQVLAPADPRLTQPTRQTGWDRREILIEAEQNMSLVKNNRYFFMAGSLLER